MKPSVLMTRVIGGLAVVLGVVLAAQLTIFKPEIKSPDATASNRLPGISEAEQVAEPLPGFSNYDVIAQRPLFQEDRKPWVPDPTDEGADDPGEDAVVDAASPLDVTVTGIIIAPNLKLAMMTNNTNKERITVQEGMPLEGELAAWRVQEIDPRNVAFVSDASGEEQQLELMVHGSALAGGRGGNRQAARQIDRQQNQNQDDNKEQEMSEAESRAEEIRRRVAERRAQLRAEAERRAQQRDDN